MLGGEWTAVGGQGSASENRNGCPSGLEEAAARTLPGAKRPKFLMFDPENGNRDCLARSNTDDFGHFVLRPVRDAVFFKATN